MVPDKPRFYRQPERMPGLLERLAGANGEPGCISRVFADGERLTWGDVSCLYGPINGWFCPDDPDGTDFPVRAAEEPELVPVQGPVLRAALPPILAGRRSADHLPRPSGPAAAGPPPASGT